MSDSITITGNITEPERRETNGGVAVTTFRLARTERRYDREKSTWADGVTSWFTVSVFRTLADHAYRSLHRGDRVIVHGRLRLREWDTGTKKGVSAEVEAEAIGPDLLWGTTTFVRDGSGGGGNAASMNSGDEEWASSGSDEAWKAPMSSDAGSSSRRGAEASAEDDAETVEVPF
ncbi:single-strand DNA-binding protein [Microbacterium endophyticum]|uniref:Single-stranded DNA-binding protein n=1 Tax=Microbacterium endophyticum TaxID=1526412 RepID=A0A7W4V118_9MICO|nr:single-stranded DNA-binding protein [Microbacterium endophyticum]MBB2974584.1 single-strand DNA-binding protein [Microbacterium endophyticum]NIK36881.1 single-strand DNA-binding protein [Microbacterium endophyticum]